MPNSFILLPGDIYEKFAREDVAMAKLTLSFIAPPDNERVTPLLDGTRLNLKIWS